MDIDGHRGTGSWPIDTSQLRSFDFFFGRRLCLHSSEVVSPLGWHLHNRADGRRRYSDGRASLSNT